MLPTPFRCRGAWKIQKRCSESDLWLDEMGLFRKHTARDPSCLFRIISENIYNTQRYFHKVRLDCVEFMASNRHLFDGSINCTFENYVREMSNPSEWGGLVEISAMSHLYRRDFVIFEASNGPQTKICNGYGKTIYLFYSPDTKHFDAVYSKDFINFSSFCQSLMYEVLYDGVFKLKDLPYAIDKMLHDKNTSNHIDYCISEKKQKERTKIFIESPKESGKDGNNNVKLSLKCKHRCEDVEKPGLFKESLSIFVYNKNLIELQNVCFQCLNVNSAKDLLDNGITPFPYKVAKALDPDIYRNIEFDVWSELRRELRYGARFSDGRTLQVGVKCLCKLESDQSVPYHCHIQEMRPDGGPCLVFIEELGEKQLVAYDQLEPLPLDEIRPWAPPYRYSRAHSQYLSLSQMLQQLGNISRKQGLSKLRSKTRTSNEELSKMSDYKVGNQKPRKLPWKNDCTDDSDAGINVSCTPFAPPAMINFSAYNQLDFIHFPAIPVEVTALPLMVDIRPVPGAPAAPPASAVDAAAPPPPAQTPHNGPVAQPLPTPTPESMHNQGASGDMVCHGMTSPASVRASTPAAGSLGSYTPNYTGGMNMGGYGMNVGMGMPVNLSFPPPYVYGSVKGGVLWCPPPAAPAHGHHPPPGVNHQVFKSVQPNGSDLPMNDMATLRFYYNLGVECMWGGCAPAGPPAPPQHQPRHYAPNDMIQEMQQMSLHDRHGMANHNGPEHNHKGGGHKPMGQGQGQGMGQDKPGINNQNKGNGQRPLLGPRFKRGGNGHDGGMQGTQNKGHNNGMNNNRLNNSRRNSHSDGRNNSHGYAQAQGVPQGQAGGAEGECAVLEPPIVPYSYMPYPPPMYPVPYYQLETDPGMMGMMGGMSGYVSYDEGCEYAPPGPQYYAPPPYPPPPAQQQQPMPPAPHSAPPPPNAHTDHK